MARAEPTRVLVHADESCLRNGMEPPNPGGNGALIEAPAGEGAGQWAGAPGGQAKNESPTSLAPGGAGRGGRGAGLLAWVFAAWLAPPRGGGGSAAYAPAGAVHERV